MARQQQRTISLAVAANALRSVPASVTRAPVKNQQAPARPTPARPVPATPPARPSTAVDAKPERVVAYTCIQPNCSGKHRLVDWQGYVVKADAHHCYDCGHLLAPCVVYLPPPNAQVRKPHVATPPAEKVVERTHQPGSRSDKLMQAMERKLLGMVKRGEKFTNEGVQAYVDSGRTDLIEAADAWLLVTGNNGPFVRSVKQVSVGQRTVGQVRGVLNFWRAEVARKHGIKIEN